MEFEALSAVQGVDFSLMSLFDRAGLVVKSVMLLLLLGSFWSWAIIIQKLVTFRRTRRDTEAFDEIFWSGEPLDELFERIGHDPHGASARIFCTAMDELHKSIVEGQKLLSGTRTRVDRSMGAAVTREINKLTKGLDFLATVGSTAPFVGLFGTVWGIMTVFREIGMQENTSLAVVAPGIGEALAATALGLAAAIPAVVGFNHLSSRAEIFAAGFEDFADRFATLISRHLDE